MELKLVEIASAAAAALAPYMPYLVEGGKGFAGKAGEAAGVKAGKIWAAVKSRFGGDPEIEGTALLVSARPEDEGRRGLLAKALAEKLAGDPEWAQTLLELLGGEGSVQEVLIDEGSWVGDVLQDLTGEGRQSAFVSKNSGARRIKQVKK